MREEALGAPIETLKERWYNAETLLKSVKICWRAASLDRCAVVYENKAKVSERRVTKPGSAKLT